MERYEINWIDKHGDEYYTGDWFFDYETAIDEVSRMNELEDIDSDRVYIVKKCNFNRK